MVDLTNDNKQQILQVFSKNLTSYRKAMKLSQDEFGNVIGITRQTVSSIERGAYSLTWPIFLSSLFIFSKNVKARQMILNSFAGDDGILEYFDEMMPTGAAPKHHDFSERGRELDFASCVILDNAEFTITESDAIFRELTGAKEGSEGSFLSYVSWNDNTMVKNVLNEKLRKQNYVCTEFRLKSSDDDELTVNCLIHRQKKLMKDGLFDVIIMPLTGEALQNHSVSGMIDVIPVGTIVYECKGDDEEEGTELYYTNKAFYEIVGHTKEQFASIHNNIFKNLVASDDVRRVNRIFSMRGESQNLQMDVRINTFEGDARWVHISSKVIKNSGNENAIVMVLTNITNRINSELNMKYQLERYRQLDEVSDDLQFNYEVTEDKFSVPVKFGKFVNSDNVIKHFIAEQKSRDYVHPDDMEIYRNQWSQALAVGGKSTAEYRIKLDGSNYNWCRVILNCIVGEEGEISYVNGRILIIDEEKRIQKEHKDDRMLINRLSSTDRLTRLYNRTAFRGRAQEILKSHDPELGPVHAIAYMDIDNFSFINEKYGYPAGDKLLRDFGQIFLRKGKRCFGCRPHSDFFIVYINTDDKRDVLTKINNWSKIFIEHQTKTYPGIDIRISAGVYYIPSPNIDINQAISNANVARKQIKESKLKNICIYTESLKLKRAYEQSIVGGIDDAIKNGKIDIFFQPKYMLDTKEIIGVEALARWREDDGSYKKAEDFIPVLESSGKIMDLDFYVYTKVLQTLKKWKRLGKKIVPISVNFSERHNSYQNFDESVYRLAEQYEVSPENIEIEVREKILASNVDNIIEKVSNLKKRGFAITLDGFGYGGSSLGFLLSAPVNKIKIDRAIWKNISIADREKKFVKALASMASAVNLDVVFEGVENASQESFLKEAGFMKAQGYYFAEPMRIEEFESKYL